jgi:hypothetical protein
MTYSGALTVTTGVQRKFKKNASFYFGDYKELAEKIKNSEYQFNDLIKIVGLYNEWYTSQNL